MQARGKLRDLCGWACELFFTRGGDPDRPGSAEGPPVEGEQWWSARLSRVVSALPCLCPSLWREIVEGCVYVQ